MIKISCREDLDDYFGIIKDKQSDKMSEFKVDMLFTLKCTLQSLVSKVKGLFFEPIPSLNNLTIGALNKITECRVPSEVMQIIFADLHIKRQPSTNDYVRLFYQFNAEIKKIEKLFENTTINDSSDGSGIYHKISSQLHINPFAVLIDQIARRFNITLDQANNLSWVDVYYSLMIDKQNYLVEREIQKKNEAELKRKYR